jgi:replicative DNA helicase
LEDGRPDDSFIEKIITKGLLTSKEFLVLVSNAFIPEYFNNDIVSRIFKVTSEHLDEFNTLPSQDIIKNTLNALEVNEYLNEVNALDFDIAEQYGYLLEQTNEYLKDKAIKHAMTQSIDIIDSGQSLENLRQKIEDALCKDLKVDLGLHYFTELGERLRRMFTVTETRIPTYFPTFDEFINGGFPPFTLSVIVAKIHGFKSGTMANWAARQVLHGHNVGLISLEMSEDMFAQRFDAIFSNLDMNRMYFGDMRFTLKDSLKTIKETEGRGELFIKQYPTGSASIRDFRIFLRELVLRDIILDILYVDYINLMRSAFKKADNLYTSVKAVAEELRALSFEFEVPVVSVSQLNREGSFAGFEDVDFNYIAESLGVPATADFMSMIGTNPDDWIYQHELHNKILKNRLGGRVHEMWKWYYDDRSLKLYDEQEMDMWIADAENARQRAPEQPRDQRRRRD